MGVAHDVNRYTSDGVDVRYVCRFVSECVFAMDESTFEAIAELRKVHVARLSRSQSQQSRSSPPAVTVLLSTRAILEVNSP